MPKLSPWDEPAPPGIGADAGCFSCCAQPSGILRELLESNARQQQWMTNQSEIFLLSAQQQRQHLEEVLSWCKLQHEEQSHGHFEQSLPETPSSEMISCGSKWAASVQLAAPPSSCGHERVLNESPNAEQVEVREAPHPVSRGIADLIGVKGWSKSEASVNSKHAISQKVQNEQTTQLDCLSWVVRSKRFDMLVGVLILINSVFIGFQVEHGEDERYAKSFLLGSLIFCVIFTAEILLRLFVERLLFFVHDWMWNVFDSMVVISSIVELSLRYALGDGSGQGSQNMSMFRTMRVLRFVRIARVLRVMRVFRELRMMIFSIIHSLHSIVWAMALLLVITFVFGITFTQGAQEALVEGLGSHRLGMRFGSLERTMLTLVQAALGGFSWHELSDELLEVHWAYEMLFCAFEAFTVLAILNVITGVFVDSAMRSASQDRDLVIQDQMSQDGSYAQELRRLFMEADTDGSGILTLDEFRDYVEDDRVQSYLRALDIHVSEARSLFNLLDIDNSGSVTVDEFITGCLRFKGEAKGVDVLTLMYENKKMVATIIGALETMGEDVRTIRRNSNPLAFKSQHEGPEGPSI